MPRRLGVRFPLSVLAGSSVRSGAASLYLVTVPGSIPADHGKGGSHDDQTHRQDTQPDGPLVQGRIVGFYPSRSGFESLAAHHASLAQRTERSASTRQVRGSNP
jgi:hypothetical protein